MTLITNKSLFLHIPKTGGTWVKKVISKAQIETFEHGSTHAHFPELFKYRDEMFYDKKYVFAFVRHPLSWYQSIWVYRMKHGWSMDHPLDYNCASNDFHEFVRNCIKFKPSGWVSWMYASFIENSLGLVDFVGKQESLTDDLIYALNEAGEEFDEDIVRSAERVNAANINNMSTAEFAVYSKKLIDEVLDAENDAVSKYYGSFSPNDLYDLYCHGRSVSSI
tara:strand:+ start:4167 stop:4829 length:663 start_codon:yes stop_codon:yes gene_type:complete